MREALGPGTVVAGRYRIARMLGQGGMGVVWSASVQGTGERVAVKTLKPRAESGGRQAHRRVLREARAITLVQHPNVVKVLELVTTADGAPALVMELLEGETLADRLRRGPLAVPEAARVMLQVALALRAAHAIGVVHRDLKPPNIFLSRRPHSTSAPVEVKVLDFGMAKLTQVDGAAAASESLTTTGALLGTPGYMSPEQVLGESDLDQRTDVWSFGAVLYECLAGRRPVEAENVGQVLKKILAGKIAPLETCVPDLPPDVAEAVATMLVVERDQRAADLSEAIEVLRRYADAPATAFSQATALPLGHARRRAFWIAIPAVAAVVVAAFSLGAPLVRAAKPAPSASAPLAASVAPHGHALVARAPVVARTPDARAAYDEGARLLRGASLPLASKSLLRAIELDPELASARVRIVTYGMVADTLLVREQIAKAREQSWALSPEDLAALEIAEASMGAPLDTSALARRWEDAAKRFPLDAETALEHARALELDAQPDAAEAEYARALSLDDGFALALWARGSGRAVRGDMRGALHDFDACLAVSPNAASCLRRRASVFEQAGDCASFAEEARRLTAVAPEDPQSYLYLSRALAADGSAADGIRIARDRAAELFGPPWQDESARGGEVLVKAWTGDLAGAEKSARAMAAAADGSLSELDHELPTSMLLRLLAESGRTADAAALAESYVARLPAWTGHQLLSRALVLSALRRSDRVPRERYESLRAAWIRDFRTVEAPGPEGSLAWIAYWAAPAADASDAEEALAKLPDFGQLPAFNRVTARPVPLDEAVGRVYLLAGRPADAVAPLERATRACSRLEDPVEWLEAQLELGRAREATGDRPGACAALAVVLRQWPKTTAPSLTWRAARDTFRTLACTP